jgi:benzylsuccinate CoA-transferase BbsF subunit
MPDKKLFDGIRIVDITVYLTGPLTTKAFSDLGAEVIRIETKSNLTGGMGGGRGSSEHQYNTNKKSVLLNFSSPRGLDLARQLIAKSDILLENLAGGTLKRRGLGYEDLIKFKPDLIMLSSCMMGQTGPHASHAASGHKLTGLSGFNEIVGWPDREPAWIGAYTDFIAPRYNILALLAALEYRRRTGKGQYIDMAQYEDGVQFMAPLILDYTVNKRELTREGNKLSYAAPHNAYSCAGDDRWCAISVFTDEEWRSFCQVIGRPKLADNPKFNTLLARKENEEELDRITNEWTKTRTAESVMESMQAAGVPAGVVETAQDQLDKDPQLKARHYFHELVHQDGGKYRSQVGAHFLLSKENYEIRRDPFVGEHNDYVYKELLGLTDTDIADLTKQGIIG